MQLSAANCRQMLLNAKMTQTRPFFGGAKNRIFFWKKHYVRKSSQKASRITPLLRRNSTKFTTGWALFVVHVIQFSCMLKKTAFFSKKNDPKRHPETMQKASHIFKVQQCHFPNHILRTFHSDPRLRSMSNYFSFFCFASRRILALTCPGHINRVPNCGEMLPSFKTQSPNFFTNSLHLALKLASLEAYSELWAWPNLLPAVPRASSKQKTLIFFYTLSY